MLRKQYFALEELIDAIIVNDMDNCKRILLENPSIVQMVDIKKTIFTAYYNKCYEILQELIGYGIEVDEFTYTDAIANSNIEIIKMFLHYGYYPLEHYLHKAKILADILETPISKETLKILTVTH